MFLLMSKFRLLTLLEQLSFVLKNDILYVCIICVDAHVVGNTVHQPSNSRNLNDDGNRVRPINKSSVSYRLIITERI